MNPRRVVSMRSLYGVTTSFIFMSSWPLPHFTVHSTTYSPGSDGATTGNFCVPSFRRKFQPRSFRALMVKVWMVPSFSSHSPPFARGDAQDRHFVDLHGDDRVFLLGHLEAVVRVGGDVDDPRADISGPQRSSSRRTTTQAAAKTILMVRRIDFSLKFHLKSVVQRRRNDVHLVTRYRGSQEKRRRSSWDRKAPCKGPCSASENRCVS